MIAADDAEIRRLVVAALRQSTVAAMRDDPRVAGYLEGGSDVALDDLDMDSLDAMEFCIAIEISTGVSIVPDELGRLRTLGSVADSIRAGRT